MATPFGHALGGLAVTYAIPPQEGRKRLAIAIGCGLIAVAPDLDFLPGVFLGQPALYHQGVSHSLGVTLVVGLLGGLVSRHHLGSFRCGFVAAGLAYLSHLVIDLFGPDGRLPYGIPILWPLSSRSFQAPWTIFLSVHHTSQTTRGVGDWLRNVLSFHNVIAIGVEIAVVGPVLAVVHFARRRRRFRARASGN